jgi:hypothetical protein
MDDEVSELTTGRVHIQFGWRNLMAQTRIQRLDLAPSAGQVSKTPTCPRSWTNFRLHGCIPTGMHGPTCVFGPT